MATCEACGSSDTWCEIEGICGSTPAPDVKGAWICRACFDEPPGRATDRVYARIRARRAAQAEQAGPVVKDAGGNSIRVGDPVEAISGNEYGRILAIEDKSGRWWLELERNKTKGCSGFFTVWADKVRKLPPAPQQQGEASHVLKGIDWSCGCSGIRRASGWDYLNCGKANCCRAEPAPTQPPVVSFPEYPEVAEYAIARPREAVPVDVSASPLAAFTAAVHEHLVPRLPKGLRCVSDVVHGDEVRPGFRIRDRLVLWVLDASGREIHKEEATCVLSDLGCHEIADRVASALMAEKARGK